MQYIPDHKIVYNRLKQSAKKRGIEFTLTVSDILNLDIGITCPILGIPMYYHHGQVLDNSCSVDRIDSEKGYVPDNIQIISWKANRAKNNLTQEELLKFAKYYII